ncbi:hypothetical protein GCM10010240_63680 [Streptomyces griseoviridis]|nr:hypothetical protein GCM10010240_63680 [Streptomyces griseoviridis]
MRTGPAAGQDNAKTARQGVSQCPGHDRRNPRISIDVSAGCEAFGMDEAEFMRGRVYGAEHGDPGPRPGRAYAQLVGGPLDGLLLDITGTAGGGSAPETVALPTEIGRYGPGGRAVYAPRPADGRCFDWQGDVP